MKMGENGEMGRVVIIRRSEWMLFTGMLEAEV
jgi:hypothetical protein